MKKIILALCISLSINCVFAQYQWMEKKSVNGRYTYRTIQNDPLGVRYYTLANGLTVIISVNKVDPRVHTLIATKAGSKNDPADNTGLAHYLEHMLFKGTDKFGTKDWAKEKEQLDKIDALYERYNKTTNEVERKQIYKQIDSVSLIASRFAIANEYDKMLAAIGASGTNAFTSVEQTVYVNDIPANQIETWLTIEAERFRNPVLRLFHTELEAVYEEKNISLDNDSRKVYESMLSGLFTNHAYGTQTTIGTVEHLKNPSLIKIRDYYNTYYVPNNMAIILAGDIDPETVIPIIDSLFGYMKPKTVPPYTFKPEPTTTAPVVKNVSGPDAESMMLAFRMPGATSKESTLLTLVDYILSNSKAGLIDLNLVKKQQVLSAFSTTWMNKDYSIHIMGGKPKQGQSLEQVNELLLAQLEMVKKGEFDENILKAIVNNFKVDRIRNNESNEGRAYTILDAYTVDKDWLSVVKDIDMMSQITKQDIMNFAQTYYQNNYVVVYKRVGIDSTIQKIVKPEITAVDVNREEESDFVKVILSRQAADIKPVFLNFNEDIRQSNLKNNIPLYYVQNTENGLFSLYYVLDMGKLHQRKLPLAIEYLKLAGTSKYTADEISKAFYALACEYGVSSTDEQTYVYVSGLNESFTEAVNLFEHVLREIKPDQELLNKLVERIIKERNDEKKNKNFIFSAALRPYLMYGKNNPFTSRLKFDELKSIKAEELCSLIHQITQYQHDVYYYGPSDMKSVSSFLNKQHKTPKSPIAYPTPMVFTRSNMTTANVFFVDYNMVQAEVFWLNRQDVAYSPDRIASISLFNEYFGGGMSSVVFQTIRESKALAYSTYAGYNSPNKKSDPYYVVAYVGTQADKLADATAAMNELLTDIPLSENAFLQAKTALKNKIETERISKKDSYFIYKNARKLGLSYEPRQFTYEQLNKLTLDDMRIFFTSYVKNQTFYYGVLGSKDKIDAETLKKLGEVTELNLTDIFGF